MVFAFVQEMMEDRSIPQPVNSPPVKNGVCKGATGKPSFARVFGAAVLFSSLVGWWFDGLGVFGFELPSQTPMYVLIGLTPYLSGKVLQVIGPLIKRPS